MGKKAAKLPPFKMKTTTLNLNRSSQNDMQILTQH